MLSVLIHRIAANALLVMALGCLVLLAARILWTGELTLAFLAWNLFLAWVPLLLSQQLLRDAGTGPVHWLGWAVWMAFWPNAPYVITDLIHLRMHDGLHLWFDLPLLFAFAWTSLLMGFESLRNAEQSWSRRFSPVLLHGVVAAVCVGGALGVYMGRYLRWNSWDAFYRPFVVLETTFQHLLAHPSMAGFALGYGAFLWIAFLSWKGRIFIPQPLEKQPVY
jgi:uncharacterized membrane protein